MAAEPTDLVLKQIRDDPLELGVPGAEDAAEPAATELAQEEVAAEAALGVGAGVGELHTALLDPGRYPATYALLRELLEVTI